MNKAGRISKTLNLIATCVWFLMMPIAWFLGWLTSIAFISTASIYANFASHLAAWRSDANPNQEQLDRIEEMLKELLAERS